MFGLERWMLNSNFNSWQSLYHPNFFMFALNSLLDSYTALFDCLLAKFWRTIFLRRCWEQCCPFIRYLELEALELILAALSGFLVNKYGAVLGGASIFGRINSAPTHWLSRNRTCYSTRVPRFKPHAANFTFSNIWNEQHPS